MFALMMGKSYSSCFTLVKNDAAMRINESRLTMIIEFWTALDVDGGQWRRVEGFIYAVISEDSQLG